MAVNFAKAQGYSKIVMVGLSGGGWTTTVAAGLDPRIDLSIPIAGSLPFAMRYVVLLLNAVLECNARTNPNPAMHCKMAAISVTITIDAW